MRTALMWMLLLGLCVAGGCKEQFATDPSLRLSFSADTVHFDTVFTTLGSATAQLRVHNPHKEALLIDHIALAGGTTSPFRLNIDGVSNANSRVDGKELPGRDSLFIFAEATIDPLNVSNPLWVRDSIVFAYNGVQQYIHLEACGQDMVVLRNRCILQDTTLTGELPYVVYGELAVDSGCTLTLDAGCRLYFGRNSLLKVEGNLQANGTLEQPVKLRGDRLDAIFEGVPYNYVDGQWGGVFLTSSTGRHQLNYVEMNSGQNGIVIAGTRTEQPSLVLENCRIHNCSQYGLLAENADVLSVNTEISNCGTYCLYLSGGKHAFIHNTVANYFSRTTIAIHSTVRADQVSVCINDVGKNAPMYSHFVNCIIAGTRRDEFGLYTQFEAHYPGTFSHNLLQCKEQTSAQFSDNFYISPNDYAPSEGKTSLFRNISYEGKAYYDFQLDSTSTARGKADRETAESYPTDRLGNSRTADEAPDLGAYEYVNTNSL